MTEQRILHNKIFDGFRAISILLVIYFHVNYGLSKLLPVQELKTHLQELPALLNISWHALGSEIIFFVSGYLLTLILLLEQNKHGKINVRNFYIKRIARILPLYYLALIIFSLAGEYNFQQWLYNLLFISKMVGEKTIIPVGWSMELQMQFFLLVPLLVIVLNKTGRPVLFLLAALVVALWIRISLFVSDEQLLHTRLFEVFLNEKTSTSLADSYYLIHYRMSTLFIGMIFAYLYVNSKHVLSSMFSTAFRSNTLLTTGIVLVAIFGFFPIQDETSFFFRQLNDIQYLIYISLNRSLFIIGISLIILKLLFAPGNLSFMISFLGNGFFRLVSKAIYPIYLFHFPFVLLAFVIVYQTTDEEAVTSISLFHLAGLVVISSILATLFSYVAHRFVELPAQRYIRSRFLHK